MKSFLELEDVWSVVDPDSSEDKDDEDVEDDHGDVAKNKKAMALITLHVEEYYLQTVSKATSAKALWTQLAATHQAKSSARKAVLRKELLSFQKAANEPVSVYLERAKSLWNELTAAGLEIKESEICWTVLSGLPNEYDMIVTVLNHQADSLALDVILPELMQVEQRISLTKEQDTIPIFGARGTQIYMRNRRQTRQNGCFYCSKPGHTQIRCQKRIEDEKRGVTRTIAFLM